MFNMGSSPSLADIAAVTKDGNGDGWGNGNGCYCGSNNNGCC